MSLEALSSAPLVEKRLPAQQEDGEYDYKAAEKAEKEEQLRERRQNIADRVHSYIQYTFYDLGAASRQQTEDLQRGLNYLKTEEDIREWERMCETQLPLREESARRLYHNEMMDKLLDAYNQKPRAISLAGIARWDRRFRDPTVDYKTKERFIRSTLPGYVQNWKASAKKRQQFLQAAKEKGLDLDLIEGLGPLADEEAFLNMDHDARTGLVAKAMSYLTAGPKELEQTWKKTQRLLVDLTIGEGACLHRSKVGTWMERIFENCETEEEVADYIDTILMPLVGNWKDVAGKYDTLHAAGLPPSFKAVSRQKFLLWHYDQRTTYVEELELSQAAAEEKESTALSMEKKGIRYDLSVGDFDEAEPKLERLLKEHPEDPDLKSMARYIVAHRPRVLADMEVTETELEKEKLCEELRELLLLIPASMRWMYEEAMHDDPATLRRLMQVIYNRKWAQDSGYTNKLDEVRQAKSEQNKQQTRQYVKHGHSKDFERIVMNGDTATDAAIQDECEEAQVLYVNSSDCAPLMDKVKANKENENFGYWTTLVLTDVQYDVQANVITNLHYPLLSRFRRLHALGGRFTSAATKTVKKEPSAAAEAAYTLAA